MSKAQPLNRECPLFTTRHAHHSAVWCVEGFSLPKLCVACATERLEARDELLVHVKKILTEFQALLNVSSDSNRSSCRLCGVLTRDRRVLEHLCGLLFGMLLYSEHHRFQQLNLVFMHRATVIKGCINCPALIER